MTEGRRTTSHRALLVVALMALPLLLAVLIGTIRGPDPSRQGRPTTSSDDGGINGNAAAAFAVTGVVVAGCVAAPFVSRAVRKRREGVPGPRSSS